MPRPKNRLGLNSIANRWTVAKFTKRITLRIEPDLFARVETMAQENNVTVNFLLNHIIKRGLEHGEGNNDP